MILQSEIDQMNSNKRVKILLIILTTLAVSVLVYVVIRAGKEDTKVELVMMTPKIERVEVPTAEEASQRLDELSKVPEGSTHLPALSPEEVKKQLEVLSKVPEGSAPTPQPSQEEVIEKLRVLNAK